jgi:hypothetical protein
MTRGSEWWLAYATTVERVKDANDERHRLVRTLFTLTPPKRGIRWRGFLSPAPKPRHVATRMRSALYGM